MRDNRPLEARADVLTFTGEPLAAELVALGPVTADIRLRASRPDTDVFARVCDVYPDGASLNVCDGLVRLTGGAHALRAQPGDRRGARARDPVGRQRPEVFHDPQRPSSVTLAVLG